MRLPIYCEYGPAATAPLLHSGITTGSSPVIRTILFGRSGFKARIVFEKTATVEVEKAALSFSDWYNGSTPEDLVDSDNKLL